MLLVGVVFLEEKQDKQQHDFKQLKLKFISISIVEYLMQHNYSIFCNMFVISINYYETNNLYQIYYYK
jgi:hypothetical protein